MKVCPKCFESNDPAAEFCKECGAPFVEGGEGSDQEVYNDLARANLLRMRGDMKAANDVCLGILRRYPNNPTAHGLLGDIAADQGDLGQAVTWYEMALELVPDSVADKQKLESVRERIKLKESLATSQQIGIPEKTPRTTPYVILVGIIVLAVAAGAYIIGKNGSGNASQSTINTPVQIPETKEPERAEEHKSVEPEKTDPDTTATAPTTPNGGSDAAILSALQSKGNLKVEYVGVTEDPRGQSAIVTIKATSQEVPGLTATKAGIEFYSLFPAFRKLTVRVADGNGFSLVADMTPEAAKTAKEAVDAGDSYENQSQVALSLPWTPPHTNEAPGGEQVKQ